MDVTAREVLLVRHGVGEDQAGRCIGWTDVPLSAAGAGAVQALAASGAWRAARLVTSDLARASNTAALLAEAWALPPALVEPRLREMHFGVWDGRSWSALAAEDGDRLDQWMARWWEAAAPDGESFAALRDRVGGWWSEVIVADPDPSPLCVVTHAGAIRALLAHLLELPASAAFRLDAAHAHCTLLRVGPDGTASLSLLNSPRLPG